MLSIEKARFDARLPKEQKDFFEYAASIGGYRTVTEFIISSAQKQADEIVENHNKILASNIDRKVFFDTLLNPEKPNDKLKSAMKNYNSFFGID